MGNTEKDKKTPKGSRDENDAQIQSDFNEDNWSLIALLENIGEEYGNDTISQIALA